MERSVVKVFKTLSASNSNEIINNSSFLAIHRHLSSIKQSDSPIIKNKIETNNDKTPLVKQQKRGLISNSTNGTNGTNGNTQEKVFLK